MRLNNADKALLYRILKPFTPPDYWAKKETAEYAIFFKRLVYSMHRTGFNMWSDLSLLREQRKKALSFNKVNTV